MEHLPKKEGHERKDSQDEVAVGPVLLFCVCVEILLSAESNSII
jgi:hypothetical protein